jgi:putative sugar O-methyltransferase
MILTEELEFMTSHTHYHDLLRTINLDMQSENEIYHPSHFWEYGSQKIAADLATHGIDGFRRFKSSLNYFVPTYKFNGSATDIKKFTVMRDELCSVLRNDTKSILALDEMLTGYSQALADYRVYLASESPVHPYTDCFSESKIGNPIEQFKFSGRQFSRSALNYLLGLNFLKSCIQELNIKTVIEIGGGFGSLGEILLSDLRNDIFYTNIDIPPTIIFSTYYLDAVLGRENVANYLTFQGLKSHNLGKLRRNFKAAVIAPWQIEQLDGEVDLFVNFISFQEMEPDIVTNYLHHIDRMKTKYILLRNLREGKQIAEDSNSIGVKKPILADDYDEFLFNYKLVSNVVFPYGYKTVDGFNSELRLYKRK